MSDRRDRQVESDEDPEESQQRYPGLDKRHGFFQVIKKNQVSRNDYHWSRQEWQQRRKETVEAEVQSGSCCVGCACLSLTSIALF